MTKKALPEAAYYAQFPNARHYLEQDHEDEAPQAIHPHPELGEPIDVKALMRGTKPTKQLPKTPMAAALEPPEED